MNIILSLIKFFVVIYKSRQIFKIQEILFIILYIIFFNIVCICIFLIFYYISLNVFSTVRHINIILSRILSEYKSSKADISLNNAHIK